MPTTDPAPAASATAVCKSFPGGIIALQSVDFEVPFGQVTAIVGSNGSGKTTLLRIFSGLLRQDAGQVQVLGHNPIERSKAFRRQICYASQDSALDPEMTGRETLAFFAALYGIPKLSSRERLTQLATDFGLEEHVDRRVRHYSGGLRKRLHLALGLIHDPKLIVVDEPTAGLDPSGCDFFWSVMRSRADQGCGVLVVSHDMDHVARYSSRVALFDKGKLLLCDTPLNLVDGHGSPILQLTLSAPLKDENLQRELAAIPGVRRMHAVARQITLSLDKEGQVDEHVFDALKKSGIEAVITQRKAPDILSSYFNLTGRDVSSSQGGGQKKSREKGA